MPSKGSVSIGICAHNEQETIGQLLAQIIEEKIPVEEIIVVVAGEDNTADIVEERKQICEDIRLIKEKKREGQIAAQNKILSHATGDAILLIDGDGVIDPGSLEELYSVFNGSKIAAGKEIPVTEDSFIGKIIDIYGAVHHQLCLRNPRFSTHIGIFPSDLVNSFPQIVLDDAYVEHRSQQDNLPIEYVPEAVKYHNTPNNLRFFFHQQKKNWAGRFEANKKGYWHSKSDMALAKVFLQRLGKKTIHKLPYMISLAGIELIAYIFARLHQVAGRFPVKWWRPP